MTTKELIKLLQRLDPDGNKEVVFSIDYDGEYEKDALIDDQGRSWGVCTVDLKTRMIHFDTEWWYGSFDDYVEREMEPLIKAGLIEEI